MDKKKYNNGNFKVYNDYLIRDPSEYGIKDTYNKPNQYDISIDLGDQDSTIRVEFKYVISFLDL